MMHSTVEEIRRSIAERRSQLIRNTIVTLFCVLLIFDLRALWIGAFIRIAVLSCALCVVLLSYFYNRIGATRVALVLLFPAFWTCIVLGLLTTGGTETVVVGWLLILVTLAGLLGGKTHCGFWLMMSCVTLCALWGLEFAGTDLTLFLVQENKDIQLRIHVLAQLVLLGTVVLTMVRMSARYEEELVQQVDNMAQEVEQRRLAENIAIMSDKSKTQFLANMSHEIRTPLNSIIGFSSRLMKRKNIFDAKDEEAIDSIHRNGKGLLYLVNELLELANIESSPLLYSSKYFSADSLVREVITGVERDARGFGLRIDYLCMQDVEIKADRSRLHKLLSNILYFGIRQTLEGGLEVSVAPATRKGVEGLQIVISDTSPGIAEEQLQGLFETHYQLVLNSNRDLPISALTLAVAAKFVQMHDGQIRVQSVLGNGTRFFIWLPSTPKFERNT